MGASPSPPAPPGAPQHGDRVDTARGWVRDVGGVLLSWAVLIVLEFLVVSAAYRNLFAGSWELAVARKLVGPIALAMLLPAALIAAGIGRHVAQSRMRGSARLLLGVGGGVSAALVGVGVSQGRHFASMLVRAPFVGAAFVVGFGVAYAGPSAARVLEGRSGRAVAVVVGAGVAAVAWLADGHVLPRLYPIFHDALLALLLASAALTILGWRTPRPSLVPRGELVLGSIGVALGAAAILWAPFAARRLARFDNLRLVLDEHAPLLGRAVHVAAWLAPSSAVNPDDTTPVAPLAEVPRALDWSGQDILLISVDALRADHISAYGYARRTTPNLDALAKDSAMFEHAYCPTPHTSYSVTSMMTGKAMRPLLALGVGEDSDTWATDLRRYGYKTAAFYPPAVFYIDASRFTRFEQTGLGFEYRWVEFTSAEEKVHEVERYLATAGPAPLFLWVHLFEPHEPYVTHPSHLFTGGEPPAVDAYDSEVAYADEAIGNLLRVVRAARPKVTVVVTADHGEEFGDHGGRYHGTTCYEEQVRVPLLVSGPGVVPGQVATVVQTIDLLPTVLSALGIPRPARVRGRDLGALLAGSATRSADPGLAYSETDDQTLLARGDDRLICARAIAACALYDVAKDPFERADLAPGEPAVTHELRAVMAGLEREQGRYEASEVVWPDALRRGMQGEADAAEDVAALLDDANVAVRRKAAEVTFQLAVASVLPEATRAFARDEDPEVRRWLSLALVRMGNPPSDAAAMLVHDADVKWRRVASLAFALRGDPRGNPELASWWTDVGPPRSGLDAREEKLILRALGETRDTDAVPGLLASLGYVPLRPSVAAALGAIGDARARQPLLSLFQAERNDTARSAEARALAKLGVGASLLPPLTVFAGLPDPMTDAVMIARDAGLLDPAHGGSTFGSPVVDAEARLSAPPGPLRLWVLAGEAGGTLAGEVSGERITTAKTTGAVHAVDLQARAAAGTVDVRVHEPRGVRAVWVVARQAALPSFLVPREPDAGPREPAGPTR